MENQVLLKVYLQWVMNSLERKFMYKFLLGYLDHYFWSDFLVCQEIWISYPFWSKQIKSGLGPCIAPKAGLVRHPVKGKYCPWSAISVFNFLAISG